MKLYHYAPKENTVKEKGLLSISKGPRDLRAYAHRAGSENKDLLYAMVRHYLIVLKDGYIPPQFLTLEC